MVHADPGRGRRHRHAGRPRSCSSRPASVAAAAPTVAATAIDLDHVRADLAEVLERHDVGLDAAAPTRSRAGARPGSAPPAENVADLVDDGQLRRVRPARRRRAAPAPVAARS